MTGVDPMHHVVIDTSRHHSGCQDRQRLEVMFHDDERIVHLLQDGSQMSDVQSVIIPLAKVPEVIRAMLAIVEREKASLR